MNEELTKIFTKDEIYEALKQMRPTKALGPDDMSPIFFQKYWHIIGDSVPKPIVQGLNYGEFYKNFKHTFATLIPNKKKKYPLKVSYYHPRNLCNVLYKLISKTITNRLKGILLKIISKQQRAFM